ncbi:MAG: hypothetical protein P8Z40_10490 [Chloroflexota bacterium]|jgi:NADPH:quinone reductase-like Zn-dependent oxidoreductase
MRAAVYERYGPPEVLQVKEVARPSPREDEILVRVRATTVRTGEGGHKKGNVVITV